MPGFKFPPKTLIWIRDDKCKQTCNVSIFLNAINRAKLLNIAAESHLLESMVIQELNDIILSCSLALTEGDPFNSWSSIHKILLLWYLSY